MGKAASFDHPSMAALRGKGTRCGTKTQMNLVSFYPTLELSQQASISSSA